MPTRGEKVSATERMEAARRSTKTAITRELLMVSIMSRIWPAHLCDVKTWSTDQQQFVNVTSVCLHTPAGNLVWRLLNQDEALVFEHLKHAPADSDDPKGSLKLAALLHLATEGW